MPCYPHPRSTVPSESAGRHAPRLLLWLGGYGVAASHTLTPAALQPVERGGARHGFCRQHLGRRRP